MSYSSNPTIQHLMNEASSLDSSSENIEEKLQIIAQAVALEQQRVRDESSTSDAAPSDPQDAFACEGCQ